MATEKVSFSQIQCAHDKITQFHIDKDGFRKAADAYAKGATDKAKGKAKSKGKAKPGAMDGEDQ